MVQKPAHAIADDHFTPRGAALRSSRANDDARRHVFSKYETHWYLGAIDQEPADEGTLASWWSLMGLPNLPPLVDVLIRQSIQLSTSHLQLRRSLAALPSPASQDDGDDTAAYPWIARMALYQNERLSIIASFASCYVACLLVSERMQNVVRGMGQLQAFIDGLADGGAVKSAPAGVITQMHQLHTRHESLASARDEALLSLAEFLSEPFDVTYGRVLLDRLPHVPAPKPAIGTPMDMINRRPDLIALNHALQMAQSTSAPDGEAVCAASLDYDRARLGARTEVERALRRMRAHNNALPAIRECVLVGERSIRQLEDEVLRGRAPLESLAHAHYELCIRRDHEIECRGSTYLASIDIYRAIGGGWPSEGYLNADQPLEPVK